MKILITGGAGFIGSNLSQLLLTQNHQVTVLDNFLTGRKKTWMNSFSTPLFVLLKPI
jgi:UDP-N-acetylglucosamine 4-epimerase